jgi:peptidoglycan/xylan/chitin deacetylase (PgdA/CDA1 family)
VAPRWLWLGAVLGALAAGGLWMSRKPVAALSRVPTTQKVVALTFDDGPAAPYTAEILHLLRRFGDRGTFFVVGREVKQFPTLLVDEVKDGMEIGLHGMTHLNLRAVGIRHIVADAVAERQYLHTVVPKAPIHLYRTPYGYRSAGLEQELWAAHLSLILWDVDTRDWTRPGVGYIVRQVERLTKPGSIILFHDGGGNRSQTVAALAIILPWLQREGYRAVTVQALIQDAAP